MGGDFADFFECRQHLLCDFRAFNDMDSIWVVFYFFDFCDSGLIWMVILMISMIWRGSGL